MSARESLSQETEVAIWGPTASGKDWLFKGFVRELEYYNEQDTGFHYELRARTPGFSEFAPVDPTPPIAAPTPGGEDHIYTFHRVALKKDEAHLISTHEHRINFHNNRGGDLLASLTNQNLSEESFLGFRNSPFLLITLDPDFRELQKDIPESASNPEDDYLDMALSVPFRRGLTKDQYFQMLSKLLQILAESQVAKRYLAICITKVDILKFNAENPWLLLEHFFGQNILRLINTYNTRFNLQVFATSAAGYTNKTGRIVSNHAARGLIDPQHWNPINCAAPFFWIFQNRELEQIRSSSNFLSREYLLRRYIKYPGPRLFP